MMKKALKSKASNATLGAAALALAAIVTSVGLYVKAVVITGNADIGITLSDDFDPLKVGDTLTYTATVTNYGPDTVGAVYLNTVNDLEPTLAESGMTVTGCTMVEGKGCLVENLAPGQSVIVTASGPAILASQPRQAGMHLALTAAVSDPNSRNNEAVEKTLVAPRVADLTVSLSDLPDPVKEGQIVSYTLTVRNDGPDTAKNVVLNAINDTVSPIDESTMVISPMPLDCNMGCHIGDLESGATVTYTVSGKAVHLPGRPVGFHLIATSDTPDKHSQNNDALERTTVEQLTADVSMSMTDQPDPVAVGETVTYHVVIKNSGPDAADDVMISAVNDVQSLIDESTLNVVLSQGTCGMGGCNVGTIPAGGQVTATVSGTVVAPLDPSAQSGAHFIADPSTFDPHEQNNDALEYTRVLP